MIWTIFFVIGAGVVAWGLVLLYRELRLRTIRIDNGSFVHGDALYYGENRIALPKEGAVFLRISHREPIVFLSFERDGALYDVEIPVTNGDLWSLQFEQGAFQTSLTGKHPLRPR
jgi:hypothetical protein